MNLNKVKGFVQKAQEQASKGLDAAKTVAQCVAEDVKGKAIATAQVLSDKETYVALGKDIQTRLTEDKDGDGIPDILQDAGKGAVKIGKTISGVQAFQDAKAAKDEKTQADEIKAYIEEENERRRAESNAVLDKFGRIRLKALQDTVGKFIIYLDLINKRGKVNEFDVMTDIYITPEQVKELGIIHKNASNALTTLTTSDGSAVAIAMGVPSLETQLAETNTGAATTSLRSKVSPYDAFIAWLSGSTSGVGLGLAVAESMAGLTMFGLMGLACYGAIASALFAKKHTEATQYLADMQEMKAKMELGWTMLDNINKRALELQDVTLQLKARCLQTLEQLADIIIDFDPNNKEHQIVFQQTTTLIKSMSELVQVPVMDDEGNVSESAGIIAEKVLKVLNNELH